MSNTDAPTGPTDQDLVDEIAEARDALQRELRSDEPDPELVAALRARIAEAGDELQRRRDGRLADGLRSGPLADGKRRKPKLDPGLHDRREQGLADWARELGLPWGLFPGTDLSDDDIFEEIVTDLHSYEKFLEDLERRREAKDHLAGMDAAERVIEALERAIASGRIDDAIAAQLRGLLDPETLKWLPLFIGLAAGLGLLGGGWAMFAGLVLAYGPTVYTLASALHAAVYAETAEEFDAAVEQLVEALGGAALDLLLGLAGGSAGKGAKTVVGGGRKAATAGTGATRGRRPPARPRRDPGGAGRGRTGALPPAHRPVTVPPTLPRHRPPWLGPQPPPRASTPRRPSREGAMAGGVDDPWSVPPALDPTAPRRPGPSPTVEPHSPFNDPENVRRFGGVPGQPREEVILGWPGADRGLISPEGFIIIDERLARPGKWEEFALVWRHEHRHRQLRPHDQPQPRRGALAQRIGDLLVSSHAVKFLDEFYAYLDDVPGDVSARIRKLWDEWMGLPEDLFRFGYGISKRRTLRELVVLRRDPEFARALAFPEEMIAAIDAGIDLEALIVRLEAFLERWREVERAAARRGPP